MNLNIENWKEFSLGNLFSSIYKSKTLNKDEIEKSLDFDNSIRYITRTENNNGCEMDVNLNSFDKKFIEKGNAITIGDTTATCFYQNKQFITGDHIVVLRADWLNEERAIFILSILNANKYKYSYGRAYLMERIKNTIIKLPIAHNSKNMPLIDTRKKYSEDGYVPDWDFMENYIKSLHHKKITTKNKKIIVPNLDTGSWKEFRIPDLFDVCAGEYYSSDNYCFGKTPYISASGTSNGVGMMTNLIPDFKRNKITIGKVGATAYYQPEDFCATSDVNVLTPLFNMNEYIGIFISQVINYSENYKWSYGRQCRVGDTKKIIIKLPVKKDEFGKYYIDKDQKYSKSGYVPDWDFMENYIKSLNYGDRLTNVK